MLTIFTKKLHLRCSIGFPYPSGSCWCSSDVLRFLLGCELCNLFHISQKNFPLKNLLTFTESLQKNFFFFALRSPYKSSHQKCSVKKQKVFLEISQNSHENTGAIVSFLIKLQTEACSVVKKRDSGTDVFLWVLRNF